MHSDNNRFFALTPVIPHLIIIAIVIGAYYFITSNEILPDWTTYFYYGMKAVIVLEIILASARSFLVPIIGIILGASFVYVNEMYQFTFATLTTSDGWQLLVISVIGLLISALIKLK